MAATRLSAPTALPTAPMTYTSNETQALITSIKTRSEGAEDASRAIHLIRLIPYAGGVIGSYISENANQRRFEKTCDVLSDLDARLEEHGSDPELHLSKDQIIEVVHETLQTALTASDEKKIEALKEGLGYAFLSDDTFERNNFSFKYYAGAHQLSCLSYLYYTTPRILTFFAKARNHPLRLARIGKVW